MREKIVAVGEVIDGEVIVGEVIVGEMNGSP